MFLFYVDWGSNRTVSETISTEKHYHFEHLNTVFKMTALRSRDQGKSLSKLPDCLIYVKHLILCSSFYASLGTDMYTRTSSSTRSAHATWTVSSSRSALSGRSYNSRNSRVSSTSCVSSRTCCACCTLLARWPWANKSQVNK